MTEKPKRRKKATSYFLFWGSTLHKMSIKSTYEKTPS